MAETTVRVTVTVPRELKAEMDKHGEKENWSAVAAQAFRARVEYHDEMEKAMSEIGKAAARLKAMDAQEQNEYHKAGLATGRRWAAKIASPSQLRRLDRARGEGYPSDIIGLGVLKGNREDLSEILQGCTDSETDHLAFWSEFLSPEEISALDEDMYAIGFIEGALEVWKAVEKEWEAGK